MGQAPGGATYEDESQSTSLPKNHGKIRAVSSYKICSPNSCSLWAKRHQRLLRNGWQRSHGVDWSEQFSRSLETQLIFNSKYITQLRVTGSLYNEEISLVDCWDKQTSTLEESAAFL